MPNKELQTLEELKNSLISASAGVAVAGVRIESPAYEVERSLSNFLKHRLQKLQESHEYEEQIKDIILTRIGEATFPQLLNLLEILQHSSNMATEKILAPFLAAPGGATPPLLDQNRACRDPHPEERIFSETNDKKILQALDSLNQFLDLAAQAKKSSEPKIVDTAS